MSKLASIGRGARRLFTSIPFFVVLGLVLGGVIAVVAIPRPIIATISISGAILDQSYADDIVDTLQEAREDRNVKAVVLRVDSPGGGASTTEQIYLDILRLRERKPVVTTIGTIAASGGYYAAVASNYIFAEPTSEIGSIGVWVTMPEPEPMDESTVTSGPFKASGGPTRKYLSDLETVRQEFVGAVTLQRGDRLRASESELSRAQIYLGVEALRYGLIDEIGTRTAAVHKAAELAGLRNYRVQDFYVPQPLPFFFFFGPSDLKDLKAQPSLMPRYYYLYFESR
ncbi:MAG: S49 family peptidase [Chloroflexi bacterium]|nr:S49 family peptidase [Chloroflexota bacterium]